MLARWMDVDFEDATKDDIYALIGEIEKRDFSDYTKYDYKVCIKKFYRWIYDTNEDPEFTKWIKPSVNKKNFKLPEELLTEADIKEMILAADHPRDKAIVALFYDTGARSSEIGNLKIKNVVFDQYGAVVTVDG
ncbi:tyrosine-type recombinase/integrase [Methanolobus halotolerans]|uniref:Tyr recombinase domain-containing protein n=1 Tax=Methanolobus halotolerans TaxID=2052935 RepID=A0A4E0PX77_9EURY|nr:tyrosine-type recombinase/integrase [Methanolobus halotolerans]TGC10641.1 hypothetical protein CUN85_03895 [Methanolobus halotolerans]